MARLVRLIAIDCVDPLLLTQAWCQDPEHEWFNKYAESTGDVYTGVWRDCLVALIQHYRGELDLASLPKDVKRRLRNIEGFQMNDREAKREHDRLVSAVAAHQKSLQFGCCLLPGKRSHIRTMRSDFLRWLSDQGAAAPLDLLDMSRAELDALSDDQLSAVSEWFLARV